MQYILSEKEYNDLLKKASHKPKWLQELCTKIADEMPVKWGWGDKPDYKPWGCIKTTNDEWYCDTCPVQKVCPEERKHYSK